MAGNGGGQSQAPEDGGHRTADSRRGIAAGGKARPGRGRAKTISKEKIKQREEPTLPSQLEKAKVLHLRLSFKVGQENNSICLQSNSICFQSASICLNLFSMVSICFNLFFNGFNLLQSVFYLFSIVSICFQSVFNLYSI